jgi:hypothetical protein
MCRDEQEIEVARHQIARIAQAEIGRIEVLVAKLPAPDGDRLKHDGCELLAEICGVETR